MLKVCEMLRNTLKQCLGCNGVEWLISLRNHFCNFGTLKKVSLRRHPIYSIRPKMMFGSVSEHFAILQHEKWWKLCFGHECTISQYRTSKKGLLRTHPIYSIRPKTMFGSVSEHFANLRNEKWCKTCVSFLNALFRRSDISKKVLLRMHPIYSIRPI